MAPGALAGLTLGVMALLVGVLVVERVRRRSARGNSTRYGP
jgi:hypothetical protein